MVYVSFYKWYQNVNHFRKWISCSIWVRLMTFRNNWLMDDSIELFTSAISTLNLRTLRMCNNQFGWKDIMISRVQERNISCLSFIATSHIEELYLDNNRIGNAGLQHLLTLLMNNHCLKRLSIRNNDIGDTGALLLVDFLSIIRVIILSRTQFQYRNNRYAK